MRVCPHCRLVLTESDAMCPRDGNQATERQLLPPPPPIAERFASVEPFAQGECGTLYLAEPKGGGVPAVLKVLEPAAVGDSSERSRLKRELRKQTTLTNNSLGRVSDSGEDGGRLWLLRDHIEGESLAAKLTREGSLEPTAAFAVVAQVASALDELHRSGLLHRDVKPGHILLTERPDSVPSVRLVDAGLPARIETGGVFALAGTPAYMSPEQAAGKVVSFRSDLYALGCVFQECLTGQPPFVGDDAQAVMDAQQNQEPELPDLDMPLNVKTMLGNMLSKEPRRRPFSAQQVRRTLDPLLPETTPAARSASHTSSGDVSAPVPGLPVREDTTEEVLLEEVEVPADTQAGAAFPPENPTMNIDAELDELAVDESGLQAQVEAGEAAADGAAGSQAPPPAAGAVRGKEGSVEVEGALERAVMVDEDQPTQLFRPDAIRAQHMASTQASDGQQDGGTVVVPVPSRPRGMLPIWGAAGVVLVIALFALLGGDEEQEVSASTKEPAAEAAAEPAAEAPEKTPGGGDTPKPAPAQEPTQAQAQAAPEPQAPSQAAAPKPAAAKPRGEPKATTAKKKTTARASSKADVKAPRADRAGKAADYKTEGRIHFQARRYREAARAYEKATRQSPSDAGAFAGLGASRLQSGDAKGAIRAYQRASQLRPSTSGFHAALGRAYQQKGDKPRAIAAYRRAVKLNPKNTPARKALERLGASP